jgi:uncharacterized membrane protein YkoI
MKLLCSIFAVLLAASSGSAQEKLHAKVTKEQATKTVLEQFKNATVESSELEREEGKLIWSFDLKIQGTTKEVWVDAETGAVIKTEEESAEKEKAEQISEKAEKAALKKVPGTVEKRDVKQVNGKKIYSFEIKKADGKTVEVDVNAKTNTVIRVEQEEAKEKEKE